MNFRLTLLFFIFSFSESYTQNTAIGQWQVHLSYNNGKTLAEAENKVYCGTQSGLFYFNKEDDQITRLSKVDGLSDLAVNEINYNYSDKTLVVAYSNSNIDIIQNNKIFNIADIKNKSIVGNKNINDIMFMNEYAYLSCGFGIVVLNTANMEIKESYINIGSGGAVVEVYGLASDDSSLFAATSEGIIEAPVYNANLLDYRSWYLHGKNEKLPQGSSKAVTYFNGLIHASVNDTVFSYLDTIWEPYKPGIIRGIKNLESLYNKLVVTSDTSVMIIDTLGLATTVPKSWWMPGPTKAIIDKEGIVWVADNSRGLVKYQNNIYITIKPNGPYSDNVFHITTFQNDIWVAAGGITPTPGNLWSQDGIYSFLFNSWNSYNTILETPGMENKIFDIIHVEVSPVNKHVFAGSFYNGLAEFNNDRVINIFNDQNSSLQKPDTSSDACSVASMTFDNNQNLWVTNSGAPSPLSVMKTDNTWKSFNFGSSLGKNYVGKIIIDSFNQKWILLKQSGILVYNDNNTIDDTGDDQYKILSNVEGKGNLPSNSVFSIAEDRDGKIWVGTDEGIAVFYAPELVFTENNYDAQQILVEQDGYAAYLLETEYVNTIAIDGANRKWVGTNNGVWLLNTDGTKVIDQFTEINSPLLSDQIISIAINQITGEVFFGTAKGIVSYRSTATKGEETYQQVTVFPNPVREDYDGLIAVNGLVTDANVKITDISGTLIYETTALGGQAIWDGKNYNGKRANTGVYLIFSANNSGSESYVGKILIIN